MVERNLFLWEYNSSKTREQDEYLPTSLKEGALFPARVHTNLDLGERVEIYTMTDEGRLMRISYKGEAEVISTREGYNKKQATLKMLRVAA